MVADLVGNIVTAIQTLLAGIGESIVSVFEDLFIVTTGTGADAVKTISTLGVWGLAFLGVGFASTLLWCIFKKI